MVSIGDRPSIMNGRGSGTGTGDDLCLGILGLGNIGSVHLQSAQRIDGVRATAVADSIAENRKRAAQLGVDKTYSDFRELLDAEPMDVVVVALPPFLHAEAVTLAVEKGCHAFVEKPFALNVEEAAEMIRNAKHAGRFLGVDHTIRYQPEIQRMKEEFDAGRIGHVPLSVISRVNNGPFDAPPANRPIPDWQLDPAATGGGALLDLGVHLFDVLEWFFGELTVNHAEIDHQLELPYEDTASIVLKSEASGTIASLNCGFFQWEEPPDVNTYFRLDGITDSLENRYFTPDNFFGYAARSATKNVWKRIRGDSPEYFKPTYYYRAHYNALRTFLEAIQQDRSPPVDGSDGLRTIELVEESYSAADFQPRKVEVEH